MDNEQRKRRRRTLGGGRSATSTYDGVRDHSDTAEQREQLEQEELDATEVNARVAMLPTEDPEFTPKSLQQEVSTKASAYEREHRLKLLHRLLMHGYPIKKIADEMGLSPNTIINDRQELYRRLREQASKLDINELIGSTMGFYGEIQGTALRQASNNQAPMNIRLSALRTALGAKNDSHRFLQAAGVFDVLSFKSGEDAAQNDIERLTEITERLLADEEANEALASDMGLDVEAIDQEKDEQELTNSLRYF